MLNRILRDRSFNVVSREVKNWSSVYDARILSSDADSKCV
jgi:hypothetical protein